MDFCKRGFTLMELMIVITIIGVLAVIAVPSYRVYVRRAHYTELIQAAGPYKLGVEECFQTTGTLNDCRQGENGVPPAINLGEGAGLIGSITVVTKGMIQITPQKKFGIDEKDTYILTPKADRGILVWHSSGGGIASGYAN